jgi:hypothetical protein
MQIILKMMFLLTKTKILNDLKNNIEKSISLVNNQYFEILDINLSNKSSNP